MSERKAEVSVKIGYNFTDARKQFDNFVKDLQQRGKLKLNIDITEFSRAMKSATDATKEIDKSAQQAGRSFNTIRQSLSQFKDLKITSQVFPDLEKQSQAVKSFTATYTTAMGVSRTDTYKLSEAGGYLLEKYKEIDNSVKTIAVNQQKASNQAVSASVKNKFALEQEYRAQEQLEKKIREKADADREAINSAQGHNRVLGESGTLLGRMADNFKGVIQNTIEYGVAIRGLQGTIKFFQEGVGFINDLDKDLTEVSIVTGKTREETAQLAKEYNKMATDLSTTTGEVAKASVIFFRQGKSQADVNKLLETTSKASAIANQELALTADQLTSALNGYKLKSEDAIKVTDKIAKVSSISASSFAELSTAMSRTATSANISGVSMDELLGYMGAVEEVTRDSAESIGNSFKTLFARFTRMTEGLQEEGVAISDLEGALADVQIPLRDDEHSFRALGEVIADLGNKWGTLNDDSKQYLAYLIAGVRQKEKFLVLMENFGRATQLTTESIKAQGTTLEQFQRFQEGNESAINRLKASMEQLWLSLGNAQVVNDAINLLTGLVNVINDVVNNLDTMAIALAGVGTAMLILKREAVGALIVDFISLGKSLAGATVAYEASMAAISAGTASAIGLTGALATAKIAVAGLINPLTLLAGAVVGVGIAMAKAVKDQKEFALAYQELNDLIETSDSIPTLTAKYSELNKIKQELHKTNQVDYKDLNNGLVAQNKQLEITGQQQQALRKYGITINELDDTLERLDARINQLNVGRLNNLSIQLSDNKVKTELLTNALNQLSSGGDLSAETINLLITEFPELAEAMDLVTVRNNEMVKQLVGMGEKALRARKKQLQEEVGMMRIRIQLINQEIEAMKLLDATSPDYTITYEQIKTAEDRQKALNASLEKTAIELGNVNTALTEFTKDSSKTKKAKKEKAPFEDEERAIKQLQFELGVLEEKYSRISDTDDNAMAKRITNINAQIAKQKELQKAYHAENEARRKEIAGLKEGSEEWAKLKDKINQTSTAWESSVSSVIKLQNQIKELNRDAIQEQIDLLDEDIDRLENISKIAEERLEDSFKGLVDFVKKYQKQELERLKDEKKQALDDLKDAHDEEVSKLKDAKEASDKYYNSQIERIDLQLKAIKKVNDAIDEQTKRTKLLDDYNKAKKALASLEEDTRLVQGGAIKYVVNPEQLKKAQEEVDKTKTALTEFERETAIKHQETMLNDRKEALAKEKEIASNGYAEQITLANEAYDRQREDLTTFYDNKIDITGKKYDALLELLKEKDNLQFNQIASAGAEISSLEKEEFKNRLTEVQKFVNSYNEKLRDLRNMKQEMAELEASISESKRVQDNIKSAEKAKKASEEIIKKIFTGGSLFRSFDVGGVIKQDQTANVHKDELISNYGQQQKLVKNLLNLGRGSLADELHSLSKGSVPDVGAGGNIASKSDTVVYANVYPTSFDSFLDEIERVSNTNR